MIERAYAKINLALDVVAKRSDGYHDLEMIMIPIQFYDEIDIKIAHFMRYSSNESWLCFNEKNTIVKAVHYMKKTYGIEENFTIDLKKHIPSRAGLAGGSSDGATIVRAISKLCHIEMNEEEIKKACLSIGADVPFCYYHKPALVTGIGEKLDFFEINTPFYVLLVKPHAGVSTKQSFNKLNETGLIHTDVKELKEKLIVGDYEGSLSLMKNSLEEPSFIIQPKIKKLKDKMESFNFDKVLMSGSGSCIFALSKDEKKIEEAYLYFRKKGYFVRKTKPLL